MRDDQELVKAAQSGDVNAFGELYERYVDKIYRYCLLRLSKKDEAQDMAAEVFLRALQSLASFRWKGAPFSAWLFRIAHNLIIDERRKSSNKETISMENALGVDKHGVDVEEMIEIQFTFAETYSAMKFLTPAQQQVIALRFGGELSIAEVAKIMEKKEGAIKALQHSAIAALRRNLSRTPLGTKESY